jgi:hypothetical protein
MVIFGPLLSKKLSIRAAAFLQSMASDHQSVRKPRSARRGRYVEAYEHEGYRTFGKDRPQHKRA